MTIAEPINVFSPTFKANPYPIYAQLREHAPIYPTRLPNGEPLWLITRYDDGMAVLKDARFAKDFQNAMTPEQIAGLPQAFTQLTILNRHMADRDPPEHTRLRALVSKAFTPRMIEQLRPHIQHIADALLDTVQDAGAMDVIAAYAFPLPIIVITEMLGIPAADRDTFRQWSNAVVRGIGEMQVDEARGAAATKFIDYFHTLVDERRQAPKADLVSMLLQVEEQGVKLSEDELIAMIFLVLVAGHETTVNLIGNGMFALLQHPEQLALLRQNPALIKTAVEEFLRYDGPLETATLRFAREDIALGDQVIRKGERVVVVLAAANHDPQHFTHPDALDITRANNPHLAFGHGIHYCLGAPLARLEGQIAISTLLRRMPNLRLAVAPETLTWRPGLVPRGLDTLPVAF